MRAWPPKHRGFTLLVMLGLLALLGVGLGSAGQAWSERVRRERESEWLRIGELYAQAIESYVSKSPGSLKVGPVSLNELVLDTRFVGLMRHLRRTYADPMQPNQGWKLLRDGQARIVGVYSDARGEPFLARPLPNSRLQARPGAPGFARWAFVARPVANPSLSALR
ncbi:MAG: type II secretion system protein [Rubrivivax sp.]|nr:MAG: type II secretion system protein [Rubrivivax sp.]